MRLPSYDRTVSYVVPVLVALALSVTVFYQARLLAPVHYENKETFYSAVQGRTEYESLRKEWRTRLFSNWLSRIVVGIGERLSWDRSTDDVAFELAAGIWTAAWLLLVNLIFAVSKRGRSLLYLLGTYAGVSFGYMPGISVRIYPWDMPALFVFSLFVVLAERGRIRWIVPLLALGTGFKETSMVLCVAFLFFEVPLRKRLMLLTGSFLACLCVKAVLDTISHSPSPVLTMSVIPWALKYNVEAILGIHENTGLLRHPVFINAGTLVGFLLLPIRSRRMLMLKTVCVLFVLGNLVFGVIREYRIWFEMIPIALHGLELHFKSPRADAGGPEPLFEKA